MSTEMATNAAIRFPMRDMSNSFMPDPMLRMQTLWKTRHAPFRNMLRVSISAAGKQRTKQKA